MANNTCGILVGERGSGKTELSKQIIRTVLANRPHIKVIIVTDSDVDTWHYLDAFDQPKITPIPIIELEDVAYINKKEGRIYRTIHSDIKETLMMVRYTHSIFVMVEDASREFDEGKLPLFIRKMILDTKQYDMDMLWIYHLIGQVPGKLMSYSDTLTLFKTGEEYDNEIKKKCKHPKLKEVMQLINHQDTPKYTNATLTIRS